MHGKVFSRLLGKKILYPADVQKCGFWPFEEEPEFEEFITGPENVKAQYKEYLLEVLGNY